MQHPFHCTVLASSIAIASSLASTVISANTISNALTGGTAYGDFRLRYESVDQSNNLKNAEALTIRSKLGYKTSSVNHFSATLEFEDSRTLAGIDDYNNTIGAKPSYSVIADPESTELDQAFIQYKTEQLTAKLGRQVLTYDNHRFVGHVGWRQDRQTFDGLTAIITPLKSLSVNYAYLEQRNRIFADHKDIDTQDHLINASYHTAIGTITGYGYFLEEDTEAALSIDTYGLRFSGATKGIPKIIYSAEYATQEKSSTGTMDKDAKYYNLEGGITVNGITAKLGYEVLGSDKGSYGFVTPLATLHKFNGWADQFLATPNEGLIDVYASVTGKLSGGDWTLAYHDFSADEDTATTDKLGNEIDLSFSKKFGKNYSAGIKYAAYSADDAANGGAKIFSDTDKIWVWIGANF